MKYVILIGRIFFSLIFIIGGFSHFKRQTIEYAAAHGVLMPNVLVPFAGIMAILGAVSIMLGYKTKGGALLLVLFLVPVTLVMHNFWTIDDPLQHMIQKTMFLKNTSMLGAALIICFHGAGPMSLDNRPEKDVVKYFEK